jgi:hypothetical protein
MERDKAKIKRDKVKIKREIKQEQKSLLDESTYQTIFRKILTKILTLSPN